VGGAHRNPRPKAARATLPRSPFRSELGPRKKKKKKKKQKSPSSCPRLQRPPPTNKMPRALPGPLPPFPGPVTARRPPPPVAHPERGPPTWPRSTRQGSSLCVTRGRAAMRAAAPSLAPALQLPAPFPTAAEEFRNLRPGLILPRPDMRGSRPSRHGGRGCEKTVLKPFRLARLLAPARRRPLRGPFPGCDPPWNIALPPPPAPERRAKGLGRAPAPSAPGPGAPRFSDAEAAPAMGSIG